MSTRVYLTAEESERNRAREEEMMDEYFAAQGHGTVPRGASGTVAFFGTAIVLLLVWLILSH